MHAPLDQMCLMITHAQNDHGLAFTYTLEPAAHAHVSAVLGYHGRGGDCCMVALLLQHSDGHAAFSVWRHDGTVWAVLPTDQAAELPLTGTMHLAPTDQQATLFVDGRQVIALSADSVGLERCSQGLGIRWVGASVRPIGMVD
jgi:hypothetical protein